MACFGNTKLQTMAGGKEHLPPHRLRPMSRIAWMVARLRTFSVAMERI